MSYVSDNFKVLSGIAKCIAKQFGANCEVVLHDLTLPYENTIVAIENGFVTGRKVGDSGTNNGLEILRKRPDGELSQYNYVNYSKNGKILRSSSEYIKDDEGNVVGSLCINFDITNLMIAQQAIAQCTNLDSEHSVNQEVFTGSVDELLFVLLQDAINSVGIPVNLMKKTDKVKVISYLDEKGAFLIKKSADMIADFLEISKFTLYNYLEEGKNRDKDEKENN